MKIEVGKAYRTRYGKKATITATDVGKPPAVFYGSVDGVLIEKWFPDGHYLPNGLMCYHDLVEEWEEPKSVVGVDPGSKDETVIVSGVYKDGGLRIETSELSTESARPMKLKISDLLPKHKYADTNREDDETIFHSEQATTVFRWLEEGPHARPVLQQKFIIMKRNNADDVLEKIVEWRTIPLVEG